MSKVLEALTRRLALPAEAAGELRVTLSGGGEVLIERHRGLLSYSDTLAEVAGGALRLRVRGEGLTLRVMTAEELRVTGRILGLDLD